MCLLCSEFEIVAHNLIILSLKKNVWLSLHDWIWRDTIFFYHAMHLLLAIVEQLESNELSTPKP